MSYLFWIFMFTFLAVNNTTKNFNKFYKKVI